MINFSRANWITTAVGAAVVAMMAVVGVKATAQQNACTTVLLCPSGGAGGIGGAGGAGGAGGTGGTSAPGGVVITAGLKLDKGSVSTGQTVTGTVTYGNTSKAPITFKTITIAARAPGATNSQGPFTDMSPSQTNVTIPVNGSLQVSASRTFGGSDRTGTWRAYSTYQDANGGWHDAKSVSFEVVAGGTGGTGGAGGSGGAGGTGGTIAPVNSTGKMTVGTQEWFVTGGGNNWAGTNLYVPNVNWATAYSSGTNIWNPQFLADLSGFSTFRHMDTNAVNWSKITSWSQRKLPNDPANADVYIDNSMPANTTGMAVEWQIDLCNRANIDCWFTHPYLADDDYIRQQATLIKSKLNPGLKAYIELSNEVWNGSFAAFNQAIQAGQAGGLPGSNQWYQGIAHEMYRALQMYQIYQDAFGASAMGSRVIRVFSESGNLDCTTQALNSVYKSSKWNPQNQKIDMLALAPYIGNGTDGAKETLDRWKSEVDQKTNGEPIATGVSQMQGAGIPLLGCYEGGMHHLQNANVFAASPVSYDAYTYMLNQFSTKMNAPCNMYTLHGTWQTGGAWGMYNAVGQPLSSANKARAAHDWINKSRLSKPQQPRGKKH